MGKVISEENRRGLQGVDVYIEKFNIGVTSSEAETLLKDVPQKVSLRFSMIGYKNIDKSIELKSGMNDIGTIFLTQDTIKIQTVLVDAHNELKPKMLPSHIYMAERVSGESAIILSFNFEG